MGGAWALRGSVPRGESARRNSVRRVLAALLAATLAIPLLSAWKITGTNVRYAYYPVSGRNHAEIVRSVRRFAPMTGRAYGIGFVDFHPDYDIRQIKGLCRVARAETGLAIQLRLPEWNGPADAPHSAARLGRHIERSIRSHELQHVRIAERYARQISSGLLRLKPAPDCWTLRREAHGLITRLKRHHIDAQKAFDRRTLKQIRRLL